MSSQLSLKLLGLPQLFLDDQLVPVERRKATALLAYLAVNDLRHSQAYSRESLSTLLWPDYHQAKAFSNLRRTIWEIHQGLGEDWLMADRDTVHLNKALPIDVDVANFLDSLTRARQQKDAAQRASLLAATVSIYRNHFLTGFSLKDAPEFNEWAFAESEELRRQLANALTQLSNDYCELNQAEQAIPHTRRLVALDPLNEAAHRQLIEVYIQAGQHSAALKQYQVCEQLLRKELNLDPQPETRALYRKIRKREAKLVEVAQPTEINPPRHNLPLQLSTFIGREKEQDEIISLIAKHRLVTLAGVGGMGKTSLSLQVGHKLLNDYHGLWFVPLEALSNPDLLPQTVASIFDLREGTLRSVTEQLINVLAGHNTLLILDNCEHLREACAQFVTTLLTNCPHLKFLVTSREILNVPGEALYSLPALSLPATNGTSLDRMNEYEAVRLFADRASLALTSFTINSENAQTVIEICRKVDGIPLAIELAAARVNILQVEEILRQLQDSFALLANEYQTGQPRQQTVQASMDWSWGLLSEAEQRFLQETAVFSGGWTLEAAQVVCEGEVLSLTSALVKKSLIAVKQLAGRQTRYRFHEIVRQYVSEKLIESGEEANIRKRHLKYFFNLAEQAETELHQRDQARWFAQLFDESDNLRAALEYARKTDLEAGLYIAGRLLKYWEAFNVREGVYWIDLFLKLEASKKYPLARAVALYAYGWLSIWLQQFTEVRSALQESLDLFRTQGHPQGEVDTLLILGYAAFASHDSSAAAGFYKRAMALAEALHDPWRQANTLFWWGWDHSNWQLAFMRWERGLVLYRELGDWNSLARILGALSLFRVLNGDVDVAQKHLDEQSRLSLSYKATDVVDYPEVARSLIALMQADYETARAIINRIMIRADELGNKLNYAWIRIRLGYIALHEGNLNEAYEIFEEVARNFQHDGYVIGVIFTLEGLAGLHLAANRPAMSAQLIGWADGMRRTIRNTRPVLEQADVDKIMTACLAKLGEVAFSNAYETGQKMTLDEAVTYALNES